MVISSTKTALPETSENTADQHHKYKIKPGYTNNEGSTDKNRYWTRFSERARQSRRNLIPAPSIVNI